MLYINVRVTSTSLYFTEIFCSYFAAFLPFFRPFSSVTLPSLLSLPLLVSWNYQTTSHAPMRQMFTVWRRLTSTWGQTFHYETGIHLRAWNFTFSPCEQLFRCSFLHYNVSLMFKCTRHFNNTAVLISTCCRTEGHTLWTGSTWLYI